MTLKGDAKFKRKQTRGLKNDTKNLVNFHASSGKSENFHFDGLLLSKECKVFGEKVHKNYVSWYWRVMQKLKKNWLLTLDEKFEEELTMTQFVIIAPICNINCAPTCNNCPIL